MTFIHTFLVLGEPASFMNVIPNVCLAVLINSIFSAGESLGSNSLRAADVDVTSKIRSVPELKLKANPAQGPTSCADSEVHGLRTDSAASPGYKANVDWRFKSSVKVDGSSQMDSVGCGIQASYAAIALGVTETPGMRSDKSVSGQFNKSNIKYTEKIG
jgi:hypothetical protein